MTERSEAFIDKLKAMSDKPPVDETIDAMLAREFPLLEAGWVIRHVYGVSMSDAVHRVEVRRAPVIGQCRSTLYGEEGYCDAPIRTFRNGLTFCDNGHKGSGDLKAAELPGNIVSGIHLEEGRGADLNFTSGAGDGSSQGIAPGVEGSITFNIADTEVLRLGPDGSFVRGVKVDSSREVYESFCAWLALSHLEAGQ